MSTQKPNVVTFLSTFKCDLNTHTRDTWSFVAPPDSPDENAFVKWEVESCATTASPGNLEGHFITRAITLAKWLGDTRYKFASKVNKGIIDDFRNSATVSDPISCAALNHFVTAESTKSIETIVTVAQGHLMAEMRGFSPQHRCWFYDTLESYAEDEESLIGELVLLWPLLFLEHDPCYGFLWKNDEQIKRLLRYYRIRRTTRIDGYQLTDNGRACLYRLKVTAELVPYFRGRVCNCIPMPGKNRDLPLSGPKEPVAVRSPEMVITSPVIQEAMKNLDRVWRDRFASSVLLTGPPGCGKENMAKSLVYGSGRPGNDLQTLSLAQGDTREHERRLFGRRCADGGEEQGLVERAEGSALFVDEAHHPIEGEGIRASLLRALESKEYFPQDSNELKQIEDVMWIFASSWPLQGAERALSRLKPEDYWTRMSHVVDIGHPLNLELLAAPRYGVQDVFEIQLQIIADLFKFFWWDCLHSFFGIDPVVLFQDDNQSSSESINPADCLKRTHMLILLPCAGNDGASDQQLADLAARFAKEVLTFVGADRLSTVSIRGIRSMTSQVFSHCVGRALSGEKDVLGPDGDEEQQAIRRQEIRDAIQDVLQIAQISSRGHER